MRKRCFMIVVLKASPFGKHSSSYYSHFLCLFGHYLCLFTRFVRCYKPWLLDACKSSKKLEKLTLGGPKFKKPSTPQTINVNVCENISQPFLPLMDVFFIEHILICLVVDPSMMWHLHQVNKTWHNMFYNTLTWNALKIVKVDNPSYHWTIQVAPKHLKHSFKT
jgi:hypothetical protein